MLVFLVGLIAKANDAFGKLYFLIGPILLIFLIFFSIHRIREIRRLYNEHQNQHKSYIDYFMRYLDETDIEKLSKTIDDSIFDMEYEWSIRVLILAAILCFVGWLLINFGSIDYMKIFQ